KHPGWCQAVPKKLTVRIVSQPAPAIQHYPDWQMGELGRRHQGWVIHNRRRASDDNSLKTGPFLVDPPVNRLVGDCRPLPRPGANPSIETHRLFEGHPGTVVTVKEVVVRVNLCCLLSADPGHHFNPVVA